MTDMKHTILNLAGVEHEFIYGDGSISLIVGDLLVEVESIMVSCGIILTRQQLLDLVYHRDNRN